MKYPGPVAAAASKVHRYITYRAEALSRDKTRARRAWRHTGNQITRAIEFDPDLFDDETFDGPILDSWDLW